MNLNQILIELVQISLDLREKFSKKLTYKEWLRLYELAEKHALLGICFVGVAKLAKQNQGPSEELYYDWLSDTMQIQQQNKLMDQNTRETVNFFLKNGFACCVLKGQSIASVYGTLRIMRTSGDVDVWLDGGRKKICDFSFRKFGRIEGMTYHHIHFPNWNDFEVESHFIPGYMNNPFHQKKLKQFFKQYEPKGNSNTELPWKFNVVYVLLHCYEHFLGRGIGIRQVMDYYFVLKSAEECCSDREYVNNILKDLGLLKFAGAMMWVVKKIFLLEEQYMICELNEKEGRFFLNEILQTGNFGVLDERYDWNIKLPILRFLANQKWNIHLVFHYPSEVLWEPFFNLYRYFLVKYWMKKYKEC